MEALRAGMGVSTMSPLDTTVSLLVTFEKARYPTYDINVTEQLFRTRVEFEQWEAANELHHLLQLSHHEDFNQLQPLIEKNVEMLRMETSSNRTPRLLVDDILNIQDNGALNAVFRILLLIMSSLVTLLQRHQPKTHRPAFLSVMDAGYVLVSACHGHISLLEKEPYKDYELAVLLLRLLLCSPFSPHRRAKWYRRLSIDLDVHLKNEALAIECLKHSLKDAFVKVYCTVA